MHCKKVLCALMIGLLLFTGMPTTALAAEQSISTQSAYTAEYTTWKQFDSRWGSLLVGNGGTMRAIGCLVTSLAICAVQSGVRSEDSFDPGTFVTALNEANGFETGGNLRWFVVPQVISEFSVNQWNQSLSGKTVAEKIAIIEGHLNAGRQVVINVNNGAHWVAVSGVQNGVVSIIDPGYYKTSLFDDYDNSSIITLGAYDVKAPQVEATSVTLSSSSATVAVGGNVTLTATVSPTNASKTITWKSSKPSVATVSSSGVVTGVKEGSATITATTANGKKATCKITVTGTETLVDYVTLADLNYRATANGTLRGTFAKGTTVSVVDGVEEPITNSDGTTTVWFQVKVGSEYYFVSSQYVMRKDDVVAATSVKLNKSTASVISGDTVTLKATVSPTDATDQTITWSSSDTTVATVTSSGKVTGLKEGTAKITAKTSNGKKATCTVTVEKGPVTAVKLSKTTASVPAGNTITLTTTLSPTSVLDDTITWTSADKTIAKVSSKGVVTGVTEGKVKITATAASGVSASCTVTVTEKETLEKYTVTADVLNYRSKTSTAASSIVGQLKKGDEVEVVSGYSKTANDIKWYQIKLSGSYYYVAAEYLEKVPVEVESVTMSEKKATLYTDSTLTLKATVSPTNAINKTLTWTSSDTSVATVSKKGVVTPVAAGTAKITAKAPSGKKATCTVTVENAVPVTKVSLSSTKLSLYEDETETLTAALSPENATDDTITWSSADKTVAKVSSKGVVTAVKEGTVKITATAKSGKKASCTVTVKAPILAETVSLNKTTASVFVGKTFTLKATVSPDDTTDKTVTWTSSHPDVATVSEDGVVTTLKAGTAKITAKTTNGKKAVCTVTVKERAVTAVTLNKTTASVTEGKTVTLKATVSPENATDPTITWSSSKPSVATVSSTGVVTAVKAGTAKITAKSSNGKKATCTVTVKAKEVLVSYITTDGIYYRTKPSSDPSTIAGTLFEGDTVKVVSGYKKTVDKIKWYKIKKSGKYYYVAAKYLKKST